MKKKILLLIPLLLSLCGCSIYDIQSFFDEINGNNTDTSIDRNESKDSITILNEVFNGTINDKGETLKNEYVDNQLSQTEGFSNETINYSIDDLEYYEGSCPTEGKINGLVIPVDFYDAPAPTKNDLLFDKVNYQSVSSYYYNSSYGKLDMNFDVLDWQRLSKKTSYYESLTNSYSGEVPGVSAIIHEVFKKLNSSVDFSKYDNDKDGYIDCLYIIYSTKIDFYKGEFWWAYNYYYFEEHTYDNVSPYSYVFAGYDFINENNDKTISTKTFIHETGHIFGLNDYYDYDDDEGYNKGGLGGADMMDSNYGDHNPFSKLSLGWIDSVQLVTLKELEQSTINLKPYDTSGQVIMICDNYQESLGLFQDYFLIIYYNNESILNKNQTTYNKDGIRVYRIHGKLTTFGSGNDAYKNFMYDNSYTEFNLIDSIIANARTKKVSTNNGLYSKLTYNKQCASKYDLFYKDFTCDTLCYYDYKNSLNNLYSNYYFYVNDIIDEYATLTFNRK